MTKYKQAFRELDKLIEEAPSRVTAPLEVQYALARRTPEQVKALAKQIVREGRY